MDWNGRDEAGREVRSGIYFIQIRSGITKVSTKVFRAR
jgi:hypothetical protein